MQPLIGLPMLKLTLPDRSVGQRCQVRDFIPRSRDFLKQLGFYWDFYFKNVISGFFGDFLEPEVRNLEVDYFIKLTTYQTIWGLFTCIYTLLSIFKTYISDFFLKCVQEVKTRNAY